ncbi:hypothetical protein [Serratia marcescens]|uniref:hypothetical protein n=1 Tax=Serratia marcescens TaxID=615 RepID=UPI0038796262
MGIWEYGNMGIWEYGNMGIWEYGNMEIWEYGNMEIWKYGNMGIWEYGNMGIWEYGNMEIWKYGNMEIWKYGNDNYVYEKSYENTPVALEPGKCVPGIGEYDFILGEGRSVIVSTPLHPYEARFIVWKRGEEVVLK